MNFYIIDGETVAFYEYISSKFYDMIKNNRDERDYYHNLQKTEPKNIWQYSNLEIYSKDITQIKFALNNRNNFVFRRVKTRNCFWNGQTEYTPENHSNSKYMTRAIEIVL